MICIYNIDGLSEVSVKKECHTYIMLLLKASLSLSLSVFVPSNVSLFLSFRRLSFYQCVSLFLFLSFSYLSCSIYKDNDLEIMRKMPTRMHVDLWYFPRILYMLNWKKKSVIVNGYYGLEKLHLTHKKTKQKHKSWFFKSNLTW